jgi:hypothetical protein
MSGMGMSGMSAADWSFASAGVFLTVLMLPAAAPMIVVFASAQDRREPSVVVNKGQPSQTGIAYPSKPAYILSLFSPPLASLIGRAN